MNPGRMSIMPGHQPELLEREEQISALAALLSRARRGEGHVALVSGEAGIGKTALLRELVRKHVKTPVRALWGGCDALFTPRPLAPLQELAWSLGGELARALSESATRDVVFRAFLEELRHPRPPALVVLEDVHWADEATLDLLKLLGRRVAMTSALLVFTWREDEVPPGHPLRSVLGDLPHDGIHRFRLQGLSAAAVEKMANAAKRRLDGLHAATAGNPFFVTEVLASDASGAVPATIRDAVLARAARLAPRARQLLDVACTVPMTAELPLLEATAGPAFAALDEVVAAGMLVVSGGGASFRHELARRALEDALTPLRARELHARVLAWLRALPDDPARLSRLAHHAVRAGDGPAVVDLSSRAATRADRLGAHREAAAHLAAAVEHAGALEPRRRAELLDARTTQCFLIDRMQEGLEAGTEALAIWSALGDRLREAECLCRLARIAWYRADSAAARGYAERATAVLEGLPPGLELAMAWSTCSQFYMLATEPDAAIAWGEKALALARERGYPQPLAHALNNVGCARVQRGDDRGWTELEESLRVAREHDLHGDIARAYANLGELSIEERRLEGAERWLEEGIAYSEERDLGAVRLCALVWRSHLRVLQARWAEAAQDIEQVSAHPLASDVTRLVATNALGLMRARRGDAGSWEALDAALVTARRTGEAQRLVPVAAARAELAWLEGDAARARREAEEVLPVALRSGRAWYVGELASWAFRGGAAPPKDAPVARPFALQLAGEWRAAADEFARLGCHYEAALACFEGEDHAALKTALAALDGMDAPAAAKRLRGRLAAMGARRIPRGPQSKRRSHPLGLTQREQEVLEILALGLSNAEIGRRLFVSAKTVDHPVSAILSKLDAPSRGAAVAKARRHGLLRAEGPGRED